MTEIQIKNLIKEYEKEYMSWQKGLILLNTSYYNMIKVSKGIIDVYLSDPHYTKKVEIYCENAEN